MTTAPKMSEEASKDRFFQEIADSQVLQRMNAVSLRLLGCETGVSPGGGSAYTPRWVTIRGTGFTGVKAVTFGQSIAPANANDGAVAGFSSTGLGYGGALKPDVVAPGVAITSSLADNEIVIPFEFSGLADVPPELEWLANITNPKTRRDYKIDVAGFSEGLSGAGLSASAGPEPGRIKDL